jgi:putative aldouronate transport system permease protein
LRRLVDSGRRFQGGSALDKLKKDLKKNYRVYLLFLPAFIFYVIFCYAPMGGLIISFQNYSPTRGFFKSSWVGLKYFIEFFNSMFFFRLIRNTLMLNVYDIVFGFPAPIILALVLNELVGRKFKSVIQTIIYMPYFLSLVVLCGIIINFTNTEGVVNDITAFFGAAPKNFLLEIAWFKPIFIITNIWQYAGWSSIVYMAALAGVDPELYDAAYADGCGRLRRLIHVTLPGIMSVVVIMFILRLGNLMSVGFEKVILLYNPLTMETADVISSYVYRRGLLEANYSFATAVGLFNSVINFGFLWFANWLSRRVNEYSLW